MLHNFGSLAFDNGQPYDSTWLFEQALIQAKVPFDVIFDLKTLSKYRLLVLADQECLSDGEMDLVREGVANGLGLVATGLTSLYTPERKLRRDFGLANLLKIHAHPLHEGEPVTDIIRSGPPIRSGWMKGRAVYIPEVKPSIPRPVDEPMTSKYWKLPVNWVEMIDSVKWAAGGNLSLEVQAPLTVTAELLHQKEAGKLVVHLINYDAARHPKVEDIHIRLDARKIGKVKQVSLHSPDVEEVRALPFSESEGRVMFSVPSLETYSVVIVSQG